MKMQFIDLVMAGIFLISFGGVDNTSAGNKPEKMPHVLVIGIDGLGAHGIPMANTPNMDKMMKEGAYSLDARTLMPSVSGPAWSGIITGATVERHGIGNNGWSVDKKELEPVYKGDHDMFPTIFGEIRKNYPMAIIGAIYQWNQFGNFIEKGVCDLSIAFSSEDTVTQKAGEYLAGMHPNFTFVHLDLVDHAGHHGGYRSEEYVHAVSKADSLVGVLIQKLKDIGMLDKTVVFIVADHGGLEKKHGGSSPDEMIVPFIIYGKGVKKGYEIKHPLFNYDLAPTVAWLFGFKLNEWVTGKPVTDAFVN